MEKLIKQFISLQKNKTFDVNKLERYLKEKALPEQRYLLYKTMADKILEMDKRGELIPVKNSKLYAMDKRIFNKYKKASQQQELSDEFKQKILTEFHPKISMKHYINNPEQYTEDRETIKHISQYLSNIEEKEEYIAINERSYEIFGKEKYLLSNECRKILSRININFDDLFSFQTNEPFFYIGKAENPKDSILIIENKDTFYSLKKLFLEGIQVWNNIRFSMLVYGEGNKISGSIQFIEELNIPNNIPIYYFGDLDPEGISIYGRLKKYEGRAIQLMTYFYEELWKRKKDRLVEKSQQWSQHSIDSFLNEFPEGIALEMKEYLTARKYVPQESLNIKVLRSLANGSK